MELYWDRYEPAAGVYSRRYVRAVRRTLRRLKAAGALVEVGLGVNDPPAWLFRRYPQAVFVSQYGAVDKTTSNIVFSETVRRQAQKYISRIQRDIGLNNFWAIRVGTDADGELSYPQTDADHVNTNSYWAYDANAQGPALDRGRPKTVPANPMPGWKPGEHTYRGRRLTVGRVARWYAWYLRALADAVNWQIEYYGSLGYKGVLKVLVPGTGYYPETYRGAIRGYLDGRTAPDLMGLGVGFFTLIPLVRKQANVEIVSTALVNGSGQPRNNGCASTDRRAPILADPPSGRIYAWSSVRWIATIAKRAGFALNGESAGPQIARYYPGVMRDAAQQMASCGLRGLMWAFDRNLYDGTPGSSLHDYAVVIRRYNRTGIG